MGDLIRRKEAIYALAKAMPSLTTPDGCGEFDHEIQITDEAFADAIRIIHELPSAQPRKGEWIKQIDENAWWYECSACGDYPLKNAFGHDCLSQFCPWCGAEMSEGEEDE